mmetsp:Transcript_34826/g.107517  ORF Transcript_34826/g.107517 Transcript_34826/m.107517 type:complete len:96 (+) Transcript_34826:2-289(+)
MLDTFIETLPHVEQLDLPLLVGVPRRAPPSRIVLRGQRVDEFGGTQSAVPNAKRVQTMERYLADEFCNTPSTETNAKRVQTMERYFDLDPSTWRR